MKKIILLRGNSGSGKTTVAGMLQRALGRNTLLISQDVVRRDMLYAKDDFDSPAVTLMTALVAYGFAHSEAVIVEGILHAQWYKPLFDRIAELYQDNIYAYYYDIPFAETLRRHSARIQSANFGEEHMRKWWTEKDYLPQIQEKILHADISAQESVELIFGDIERKF